MCHRSRVATILGLAVFLVAGGCEEGPEKPSTSTPPPDAAVGDTSDVAPEVAGDLGGADGVSADTGDGGTDAGVDAGDAGDASDAGDAGDVGDAVVAETADMGAPSAGCDLEGTWHGAWVAGPLGGKNFVWMNAGGTYAVAGGTVSVAGTFTLENELMSLVDTGSTPPQVACNSGVGKYMLTRSAGCATVTFRVVSDPCENRRLALDGAAMTRH